MGELMSAIGKSGRSSHARGLFTLVAFAPIFRPSHPCGYFVRGLVSLPIRAAGSFASIFCLPASVGFLVAAGAGLAAAVGATGAVAGAAAAGFAASPLHFATYAFSVILAASFAALLALHSSSQAFTVFFCASEGVAENARPEKITAEHTISTVRLFMPQLQFVPVSFCVCFFANAAGSYSALSKVTYTVAE